MRRLWKRLEAAFAAAAFAEEGDAETACRIAAEAEQDAGSAAEATQAAAPRAPRAGSGSLPRPRRVRRA